MVRKPQLDWLSEDAPWYKRLAAAAGAFGMVAAIVAGVYSAGIRLYALRTQDPPLEMQELCDKTASAHAAVTPLLFALGDKSIEDTFKVEAAYVATASISVADEVARRSGTDLQVQAERFALTKNDDDEKNQALHDALGALYKLEYLCRRAGVQLRISGRDFDSGLSIGNYDLCSRLDYLLEYALLTEATQKAGNERATFGALNEVERFAGELVERTHAPRNEVQRALAAFAEDVVSNGFPTDIPAVEAAMTACTRAGYPQVHRRASVEDLVDLPPYRRTK